MKRDFFLEVSVNCFHAEHNILWSRLFLFSNRSFLKEQRLEFFEQAKRTFTENSAASNPKNRGVELVVSISKNHQSAVNDSQHGPKVGLSH
jgi:hypothetical protein